MRSEPGPRARGFTLIELLIVMAIIGLLVGLIAAVGFQGVRGAEVKATQGTIAKLLSAINDRQDEVSRQFHAPNLAHQYLATSFVPYNDANNNPQVALLDSTPRAGVIARADLLKSEMPDVWFPQNNGNFPLNFAGLAYPGNVATDARYTTGDSPYVLPLGHMILNNPANGSFGASPSSPTPMGYDAGVGVYGASFAAMQGLSKNLANPLNHTHDTARSEAVYAWLIEGAQVGGLTRDNFTAREVGDTDFDGAPEFLDAWGRPLQFYRWPTHYNATYIQLPVSASVGAVPAFAASGEQRGALNPQGFDGLDNDNDGNIDNVSESCVYNDALDPREVNPVDPNGLLVAPAWWLSYGASAGTSYTANAGVFMRNFFSLAEPPPLFNSSDATLSGRLWDRQGFYRRRAYDLNFLIVSSGPDRALGLPQFTSAQLNALASNGVDNASLALIDAEPTINPFGNAGYSYVAPDGTAFQGFAEGLAFPHPALANYRDDDISSQTFQSLGGSATP